MSNLSKTLLALFSFLVIGGGFFVILSKLITVYSDLPAKEILSRKLQKRSYHSYTELLDRNNKSLGYFSNTRREFVSLENFPQNLQESFLYAEDPDFFKHYGVSFRNIFYSFFRAEKAKSSLSLTQKLVKLLFQEGKKFSLIENIFLSFFLEKKLKKEEILELYLNSIPITERSIGLASAAEEIFQKKIQELEFSESLFLVSKRQKDNEKNFYSKKDKILKRMSRNNKISPNDYEYWKRRKLFELYKKPEKNPLKTLIEKELSETQINLAHFDRLSIQTTLDLDYKDALSGKNSFLILDRLTGGVRAFHGEGLTEKKELSTGSSLIPLYLSLALEYGFSLSLPVSYNPYQKRTENKEDPSLYEALMTSSKILTKKSLSFLEKRDLEDFSKKIGLSLEEEKTSFLQLARAYGLIFNKGRLLKPHLIRKIINLDKKKIIYERPLFQEQALVSKESAYIIEKAIQGKPSRVAFFPEDYSSYVALSDSDERSWFIGSRERLLLLSSQVSKNLETQEDLWNNTLEEGTRLLDLIPLKIEDSYKTSVSKKISFGRSKLKDYPDRIIPFKVGEEPL